MSTRMVRRRRRSGLTWLGIRTLLVGVPAGIAAVGSVALVEWRVATATAPPGLPSRDAVLLAVAIPLVPVTLLVAGIPFAFAAILRGRLDTLPVLAQTARRIAAGDRLTIPYQDHGTEVGALAVALRAWQEAAEVRDLLLRAAPVGICQLDAAGVVLTANDAVLAALGRPRAGLEGRSLRALVHPDDAEVGAWLRGSIPGPAAGEARLRRADGSLLWCSLTVAPVPRAEGGAATAIAIVQDVAERKRQAEWASAVQRTMLPAASPRPPGWDLAGRWLPAEEMAGDLFDWVEAGDGHLELMVGDVMGKGMAAALVMSALRSALRAAPDDLGPADRVTRAARSMTFGPEAEGLFVTLFHARLELATGRLRYVDAGHGYCLVRRAGGAVERLATRSLPLGVGLGEVFAEGEVVLRPGDTLMVCSDGLVEGGGAPADLDHLLDHVAGTAGADETAEQLLGEIAGPLADDVTVVVLRRLATVDGAAPAPHRPSVAAARARAGAVTAPAGLPDVPDVPDATAGGHGPELVEEESAGRALLRYFSIPSFHSGSSVTAALAAVVAFLEWRAGTAAVGLDHPDAGRLLLAVLAPLAAGLPWFALSVVVATRAVRLGTSPLPVLANRARQIAAGWRVPIPYRERNDEMGDLAIALEEWQEAAAVRDVLVRRAPLGISHLDPEGVVLSANAAACAILGCPREELEGRPMADLVEPVDRHVLDRAGVDLALPRMDRVTVEVRLRRGGGALVWCSIVIAPIRGEDGRAMGFIHIAEDIGERKRQARWAATVQRQMLPSEPPALDGWEIAGGCRPADDVAGDLFDWMDTGDGHLELSVADVMGKGMGSALLMAALRTALRASSRDLGPAARLTRAAESMAFGEEAEGLFVTVFHARLDMVTGTLRYVDAGHAHVAIRRAGGAVERLPVRSLPLGIGLGEPFAEGEVRLEPGDVLLACSDGLLEGPVDAATLAAGLRAARRAPALVDHLLARAAGAAPADDATAVVLVHRARSRKGAETPPLISTAQRSNPV